MKRSVCMVLAAALALLAFCPALASGGYYANMVTFGHYEQDANFMNGEEPIEWYIVDRSGDSVLLVSVYCLDAMPYNADLVSVTWQTCTLRQWLNSSFYYAAFSDYERGGIVRMWQSAHRNKMHNTDPGPDTSDDVFLLSTVEAASYFASNEARRGSLTRYAMQRGADSRAWWWLRTPGDNKGRAANINSKGAIDYNGSDIRYTKYAVRPAIWVDASYLR